VHDGSPAIFVGAIRFLLDLLLLDISFGPLVLLVDDRDLKQVYDLLQHLETPRLSSMMKYCTPRCVGRVPWLLLPLRYAAPIHLPYLLEYIHIAPSCSVHDDISARVIGSYHLLD